MTVNYVGSNYTMKTDEAGAFRFAEVEPGPYYVYAEQNGYESETSGRTHVRNGATEEVEIRLSVRRLSLAGKVVDDQGKPLAQVNVSVVNRYGNSSLNTAQLSGDEGRFRFDDLKDGTCEVTASRGPFDETDPVDAKPGDDDVKVVWTEPKTTLDVHVVDASTGQTIAGADVVVAQEATRQRIRFSTNEHGIIAPGPRVRPGKYVLSAAARGRALARQTIVVEEGRDGAVPVEFRLGTGRRAHGRVVQADGTPLPAMRVAVVEEYFALLSTVVISGADGSFDVDSLPAEGGRVGIIQQGVDLASPVADAGAGDVQIVLERRD
jgi:carboxypeptidase family protein